MGNQYQPIAKTYRALLTQTGTDDPVITELYNSLGFVPVANRAGAGDYTLDYADGFPEGKTQVFIESWAGGAPAMNQAYKVSGDDDTIQIYSYDDVAAGTTDDELLSNTSILITVDP